MLSCAAGVGCRAHDYIQERVRSTEEYVWHWSAFAAINVCELSREVILIDDVSNAQGHNNSVRVGLHYWPSCFAIKPIVICSFVRFERAANISYGSGANCI